MVPWRGVFRGGEEKGGTYSGRVVLEEFFLSSCILKCLLCIRDMVETKLFLSYSSLKSVGSDAGACKGQGSSKETMRNSSKVQQPSSVPCKVFKDRPTWQTHFPDYVK